MAKNKTTENDSSVTAYISAIADEQKRKDCAVIADRISKKTGLKAKMWGTGIVGFGNYHYKYESGREGDAPLVAFASRANSIALYIGCDVERKEDLLKKFGKYKGDKGCLHIKKLEDVNTDVLDELVEASVQYYSEKYP